MNVNILGYRIKTTNDLVFIVRGEEHIMCKKPNGFDERLDLLLKTPESQWGTPYDMFKDLFEGSNRPLEAMRENYDG